MFNFAIVANTVVAFLFLGEKRKYADK